MIRFQYHSSLAFISHLRFKFLPVLQLGKETPWSLILCGPVKGMHLENTAGTTDRFYI